MLQEDVILKENYLIRKDVTCTICLDLYTEPITLTTCQHTFCLECFKDLFSSNSTKPIECPICRKVSKRRSYYLNDQLIATINLLNMYDKLLISLEKDDSSKYDSHNMESFLNDCVKYKGIVPEDLSISLSSSDEETTSVLIPPLNTSKTKKNSSIQKNKSDSKLNISKIANKKVKPLKLTKEKRKTPKKKPQKPIENVSNSVNIDEYESPDVNQLQENENKIVKLIEDDIVRNFENEVKCGIPTVDTKFNKPRKHESSFKWNSKSAESDSSKKTVSTGWSRMKTMKKQVKKKEFKYNQLNISTEINKSKSKSPQEKTKTACELDGPVVVLQRVDDNLNKNEDSQNVSDRNKSLKPDDKLNILLKCIDDDLNQEEQDIFSLCTQKLKTPPNIKEKIITDNFPTSASTPSDQNDVLNFVVDVQFHHSSTPIKNTTEISNVEIIAKQKQNINENICDIKDIPESIKINRISDKKVSEEIEIISATEKTPDSTKKLGVRTRRSLRSAAKRNSDELKSVPEKKSSSKKRKINKNNKDESFDDKNNCSQNISLTEAKITEKTSNKINSSRESTKNINVKNKTTDDKPYVENELKVCAEQGPKAINALESSLNVVNAILSQCCNYINTPSLFSGSTHSKNSKKSDKIKTNKQVSNRYVKSLPLPSPTNSHYSVDFYKTAIPCLQKIENFYDQIISLSQQITEETETFRSEFKNSKEYEKMLSFKAKPNIDVEVQTDNITCPKCFYVIDCNSIDVIKSVEKSRNTEVDSKSKHFRKDELQSSANNIPNLTEDSTISKISQKSSDSEINKVRKVNRQLKYSEETSSTQKQKFKRIRSPTPDSDCESNKSKKSNVNYSKLLYRDDIDIFFQSEPSEMIQDLSLSSQTNDRKIKKLSQSFEETLKKSLNPEDTTSKYISILEKEYKNANFDEIAKLQSSKKQNCDTVPNTILDNLLEKSKTETEKNISQKNQLGTEDQRNIDNLLCNINLTAFEDDHFENELHTNKKIAKKQDIELPSQTTNIISASIFSHTERDLNKIQDSDRTNSIEKLHLDMASRELLAQHVEDQQLDEEVENFTNNVMVVDDSLGSDKDLFGEEDNVVESTPQKTEESKEERNKLNFSEQLPGLILDIIEPPPTETDRLDWIDIAPPPPAEFQDTEKEEEPKLNVQDISSITPDIFALNNLDKAFFASNTFLSGNINSQTMKVPSQKKSTLSENIIASSIPLDKTIQNVTPTNKIKAPIDSNSTKKNLNPIVLAQRDKYSPLQILVSSKSPKQVISAAPKQQTSILNYMQTSQKENNGNDINRNNSTPAKQSVNEKTNSYVPVRDNLEIEVCESPVPKTKSDMSDSESTKSTSVIKPKHTACIAYSRLKRDEILQILSLTQKLKVRHTKDFDKSVTHLVVAVDNLNRIKDHTIKYILAIVHRVWIVSSAWIRDCIQSNRLLPEEPYEVLDVRGVPGPKISRLTSDPLLKNYVVCCVDPITSVKKTDIETIILRLGGEVKETPDELIFETGKFCLILTETKGTQDYNQYQVWRERYNALIVDIEWLSVTVGQYQIASVRPYILCAEEGINDLGYPSALITPVPETPSQMNMTNTNH